MRETGLRRLTPGYLYDITDTKVIFTPSVATTTRFPILGTPTSGRRYRIMSITVTNVITDGDHFLEIYWGTGANITSTTTKALDVIKVPDLSSGSTRTWSRGFGPLGATDEELSGRWTAAPAAAPNHAIIVEYTEEL